MKSYGAELEVQARPWANGTVSFNASYTHARYGSFGQYAFLFSKNEVPGVAPFQGSVAYDHRIPSAAQLCCCTATCASSPLTTPRPSPKSWASAGRRTLCPRRRPRPSATSTPPWWSGAHYSITAYVRNVADTRFIPDGWGVGRRVPRPHPGAPPTVLTGGPSLSDPRTFGVILGFKF